MNDLIPPRTEKYGKPKVIPEGMGYWPRVYCGMCNSVPVYLRLNAKGESELYLGMLHPVAVEEKVPGGLKPVWLMICDPCVDRVERSMREQLMRRFPPQPPMDPPPPGITNNKPWWWPF